MHTNQANRTESTITQHDIVPYKVPGEVPEHLKGKGWAHDSYHVAEYIADPSGRGGTIPVFRSGFNSDRRFHDRDFNVGASARIILDQLELNMLPQASGTPLGQEPYHKVIVPTMVHREHRQQHRRDERPSNNSWGGADTRGQGYDGRQKYRDMRDDRAQEWPRGSNWNKFGGKGDGRKRSRSGG